MIYLDSNVFIYANLQTGREGDWCRDLLRRVAQGREEGLTSALTLDEVVYQIREERGLEASVEAGRALLEMAHLLVAALSEAATCEAQRRAKSRALDARGERSRRN